MTSLTFWSMKVTTLNQVLGGMSGLTLLKIACNGGQDDCAAIFKTRQKALVPLRTLGEVVGSWTVGSI